MCCISQKIWSRDAELQFRVETKGGEGGANMEKKKKDHHHNNLASTSTGILPSVTHTCGGRRREASSSIPVKHRNIRCQFSLRPQVYLNDISGCRDNSRVDDKVLLRVSEGADLTAVQNESWGVKKKKKSLGSNAPAIKKRRKRFFFTCSVFFDLL